MGKVINIAEKKALEFEAATWVTKLDSKRLQPEEFAQFKSWLGTSKAHTAEFENAATLWGKLDALAEFSDIVPVPAKKGVLKRFASSVAGYLPRPKYALAAAAVLAISLSIPSLYKETEPASVAIYTTAIGEHKSIALTDGSKILLNTGSQVDVAFNEDRRILKLVKGEAHFDVAHNPKRPFEVHAGTNIVRAVGTAFTVELQPETVEVTVTEGRVELATIAQADDGIEVPHETSLALVNSGQSAQFSDYIQSINTIEQEEVERRLAWRKGALVFKGDALVDVIHEIGRYTKTKIVISDPVIRDLKVGGYFKTNETEAMLQALEANFGVSVKWVGTDLVYLSQSVPE